MPFYHGIHRTLSNPFLPWLLNIAILLDALFFWLSWYPHILLILVLFLQTLLCQVHFCPILKFRSFQGSVLGLLSFPCYTWFLGDLFHFGDWGCHPSPDTTESLFLAWTSASCPGMGTLTISTQTQCVRKRPCSSSVSHLVTIFFPSYSSRTPGRVLDCPRFCT